MLDLARIEARRGKDFVLQALELGQLVTEVVRAHRVPAGRAAPDIALPGQPLWVQADAGKLRQAVLNVLANAFKYSPDGGAVRIEVMRDGDGHRACIRVIDLGIGMPAEVVGHVCERFYRADKSGRLPGTGLGMSIVKEIIDLHHGGIAIASAPGAGTAVSLYLPIASAPVTAGSAPTGAQCVSDQVLA